MKTTPYFEKCSRIIIIDKYLINKEIIIIIIIIYIYILHLLHF